MTTTLVRIELVEGSPVSMANAYVGDQLVARAVEVRPERAVRVCMREARIAVPGEVRFDLPFCGKRFHIPWWEKRVRVPLREMAKLRSKWRLGQETAHAE